MLAFLILVVTLIVVYYLLELNKSRYPKDYWKKRGVPESEAAIRIFKYRRLTSLIENCQAIYNDLPNARLLAVPSLLKPKLFIRDPEIVRHIAVKDFNHFTNRPPIIPLNWEPLWDKNLFALNGQKWREMRSVLTPAFTSSKMKMMFASIGENAQNLVDHYSKMKDEIVHIEMKDVATRFTNDVIAANAFGIKVNSFEEPENKFYRMGVLLTTLKPPNFLSMLMYRFFPIFHILIGRKVFNQEAMNFFFNIINETVNRREANNIVCPDMIHLLIEARKGITQIEEKGLVDTGFATTADVNTNTAASGKHLTNTDIAAQALVFFFAGFDSASSFLTFLAYELAVNPDVQDRLRKEIDDVWTETDGKITYEALMKMKYLDMVVSESLRKWPNIPQVDRECVKDYTIEPTLPDEKPITIEKGTLITIPTYSFHRDPNYYPDPEKFDPERFNDENKHNIKPYTYFPFGLGPRNCIGSRFALMEGKFLFFHILNNFEIVTTEKTTIPPKVKSRPGTFLPEGGMHLGLKRIR